MAVTTSIGTAPASPRPLRRLIARLPRSLWILLLVLASWSGEYALYRAVEPPGLALRHELEGAASELEQQVVLAPLPGLPPSIRRHFRESAVTVDIKRDWPNVAVSVDGLSQAACLSALREVRRVDGPVVIALTGYRSARDCGPENDMTWWLMP
jgi:hypothetical protein